MNYTEERDNIIGDMSLEEIWKEGLKIESENKLKEVLEGVDMEEILCPVCSSKFYMGYNKVEREGATANCPHCDSMLLFEGGEVLDFNKHLSDETNGKWPANGVYTYSVEV